MDLATIQRYIPARVKFALKPFYRSVFPNKLHIVFYPTFRCNYRCSYCPVVTRSNFGEVFPYECEQPVDRWLTVLDTLPSAVLYIAGGEPFLYRGLPQLINNLPAKHQIVGIVTNLSVPTEVYHRVSRPIHLNASFHREFVEQDTFILKLQALAAKFHIHVNVVATPQNVPVLDALKQQLSDKNISLHVDPYIDPTFKYSDAEWALIQKHLHGDRNLAFLDFDDYATKQCSAGRNYINIAPNGDVFTCAGGMFYRYATVYSHLVRDQATDLFRMGNVFDQGWSLNPSDLFCSLPCKEPCDRDAVSLRRLKRSLPS